MALIRSVVCLLAPACLLPTLCLAQGMDEPFAEDAFPDRGERVPLLALPPLGFRLETERDLPGPLAGEPLRLLDGGEIVVPLGSGGRARVPSDPEGTVRIEPPGAADRSEELPWVEEPGRRRRFRVDPEGFLRAQKFGGVFARRWKRTWKLRIPGGSVTPPLVSPGRVYVGALDNQVYALRARNGHRIWAEDVGRRVSRPLALWEGSLPMVRSDRTLTAERPVRLVLVVPDGGNRLLALDARSGRKVAIFEVAEGEGRLVGSPAVTPDGRVAVARQRYSETEASLILLALQVQEPVIPGASAAAPGSAPARP